MEFVATAPEVIAAMASVMNVSEVYGAWMRRRLREQGMVSAGRPGRNGGPAMMSPMETTRLLTALSVGASGTQAPAAVRQYEGLVSVVDPTAREFLPVVAGIIERLVDPDTRAVALEVVRRIEFRWGDATERVAGSIHGRNGEKWCYTADGKVAVFHGVPVVRRTCVSIGALAEIAAVYRRQPGRGWCRRAGRCR